MNGEYKGCIQAPACGKLSLLSLGTTVKPNEVSYWYKQKPGNLRRADDPIWDLLANVKSTKGTGNRPNYENHTNFEEGYHKSSEYFMNVHFKENLTAEPYWFFECPKYEYQFTTVPDFLKKTKQKAQSRRIRIADSRLNWMCEIYFAV